MAEIESKCVLKSDPLTYFNEAVDETHKVVSYYWVQDRIVELSPRTATVLSTPDLGIISERYSVKPKSGNSSAAESTSVSEIHGFDMNTQSVLALTSTDIIEQPALGLWNLIAAILQTTSLPLTKLLQPLVQPRAARNRSSRPSRCWASSKKMSTCRPCVLPTRRQSSRRSRLDQPPIITACSKLSPATYAAYGRLGRSKTLFGIKDKNELSNRLSPKH